MSMTLEELKEKARLTDEEIDAIPCTYEKCGETQHNTDAHKLAQAQQDKDWQTFIQFCEENNIKQVYDLGVGYSFKPVLEVLK